MKNTINIKGNKQLLPYIIEYTAANSTIDNHNVRWHKRNSTVQLYDDKIEYFRNKNEWYEFDNTETTDEYIPESVSLSNLRIYIPQHSVGSYLNGFRYVLNANIWIDDTKIDFGSFIFGVNDTYAYENGPLKHGNNEYYSCFDFNMVDPFELMYDDKWIDFRHNICGEKLNTNTTISTLYVTLYIVDKYDNKFIMNNEYIGGGACFNISKEIDMMSLDLKTSLEPLGFKFDVGVNSVYDNISDYLAETYYIDADTTEMNLNLAIKSNDSIIIGPTVVWEDSESFSKTIEWNSIDNTNGLKVFFNDWNTFEYGWNLVGSFNIIDEDGEEILNLISNEIPVTQEIFSIFTNNGSEKIIDISDMKITQYNLVNKIENKILQIERPNDSKTNVMQPVFFRVSDAELLTLHPAVTENISINLHDYKAKVESFILQIEDCKFKPIGENRFGTIFKITANTLPATATSGIYYVLNENLELVTTGKYNCIR